jgi:hypothetical protein
MLVARYGQRVSVSGYTQRVTQPTLTNKSSIEIVGDGRLREMRIPVTAIGRENERTQLETQS